MALSDYLRVARRQEGAVHSEFRYDINALRAFAVLAVVAYHYGVSGFSGGFAGVDVFFVISGFLISSQIIDGHTRGDFSFSRFYTARLRRIFPALLVVCVVSLLWGWFNDLPRDYIKANRHAVSALFFVSNYAFSGERGYFDAAAHTKALLHTWSLSVEGQFYLFLPAFFWVVWHFAKRYIFIFIVGVFVGFFAWCVYVSKVDSGTGFYMLTTRAWEFLAGTLLAMMRTTRVSAPIANKVGITSLLALLAGFVFISSAQAWPGAWTMLPVGAAAALIGVGGNTPWLRTVLSWWPLQRIGDISYSLYLWHWPVLVFSEQMASMSGRQLSRLDIVWMSLLSLVLAILSWKFVEQPVRNKKGWWSNKRVVSGAAFGLIICFAFGLMVVATHGISTRLPAYVQRASQATFVNTPRDECFRNWDSTKDAPERFCKFGSAAASPTLILWGDSHANQYLTAVTDAATATGMSGLIATQSACGSIKVLADQDEITKMPPGCKRFNAEMIKYIAETASLHTVILGRWWGDGKKYEESNGNMTIDVAQYLLDAGKTVIIVGPLPVPGFDVPERWSKQQIKLGQPIDSMTTPLSEQTVALNILKQLKTVLSGPIQEGRVVIVDPLQRLCNQQECRLVDKGVSNFRDEFHLSQAGTLDFTQDFISALQHIKK